MYGMRNSYKIDQSIRDRVAFLSPFRERYSVKHFDALFIHYFHEYVYFILQNCPSYVIGAFNVVCSLLITVAQTVTSLTIHLQRNQSCWFGGCFAFIKDCITSCQLWCASSHYKLTVLWSTLWYRVTGCSLQCVLKKLIQSVYVNVSHCSGRWDMIFIHTLIEAVSVQC